MLIGTKWKIEADSMNVVLYKKTTKPEAKSPWSFQGYYSSIANALHALVDQGVRDTELADLKTITDKISELHTLIDSLTLTRTP